MSMYSQYSQAQPWLSRGCPWSGCGSAPSDPLDGLAAESIMCSAPFVATRAFIRRGLGVGAPGGPVDRSMTLQAPMRFTYDEQFPGSRPPVAMPTFGPIIPDQLSPGLDNYLTSVLYLQNGRGGGGGSGGLPEYGPANPDGTCKY